MGVVLNVAQSDGGSNADLLYVLGIASQAGGLTAEGAEGTLKAFQLSNQGIRAAALELNIPTQAIDKIISKTNGLTSLSKWAGRGFVAAGVVVNVIDGVNAYNQGDMSGVSLAGMDMVAGLGAAAIGGPVGIIMYGTYMIMVHKPIMPSGPDPLPAYPADNTYVAPRY